MQKVVATELEKAEASPQPAAFRLRGNSFLFTCNWDFFRKPFLDGSATAANCEELWKLWVNWEAQRAKELGVVQSTSTLERSLHSSSAERVHFHWKVNLKASVDQTDTTAFAFHGIRPDAKATFVALRTDTQKARGANFAEASNRAHFYVWVPKEGSLYQASTWQPWRDYRVLGKWLDELWTDGKLSHAVYGELARRVRVGYANRKRDLEQVLTAEREQLVDKTMLEVEQDHAKLRAPFRTFAAVTSWEDSFANAVNE